MNEEVIELTYRSPSKLKRNDKVKHIETGRIGTIRGANPDGSYAVEWTTWDDGYWTVSSLSRSLEKI